MGYIYYIYIIYPKKVQFATYGQFVLVIKKDSWGLLLYILSALYSQHILTPLGFYISYKTHTFLCLIKLFKIRKER